METTVKTREEFIAAIRAGWPEAEKTARQAVRLAVRRFKGSDSHYADVKAIESVTESLGGEHWNTGGGCVVGHVLVNRSTWIEIGDEMVVVVRADRPTRKRKNVNALWDLAERWDHFPHGIDSIAFCFWPEIGID